MRVDKMSMSASVEARVPFLDHRLAEFTSWIPQSIKAGGGRTKDVLKDGGRGPRAPGRHRSAEAGIQPAGEGVVPGTPGDYARRAILESRLRERGLFDYDAIAGMLKAHRTGRKNYDTVLWTLLNVSQWHDAWIAGAPVREEVRA